MLEEFSQRIIDACNLPAEERNSIRGAFFVHYRGANGCRHSPTSEEPERLESKAAHETWMIPRDQLEPEKRCHWEVLVHLTFQSPLERHWALWHPDALRTALEHYFTVPADMNIDDILQSVKMVPSSLYPYPHWARLATTPDTPTEFAQLRLDTMEFPLLPLHLKRSSTPLDLLDNNYHRFRDQISHILMHYKRAGMANDFTAPTNSLQLTAQVAWKNAHEYLIGDLPPDRFLCHVPSKDLWYVMHTISRQRISLMVTIRAFRYIRLLAVQSVISKLAAVPPEIRLSPHVQGTYVIMVHLFNSVVVPSLPSDLLTNVLREAAWQWVPDTINIAEASLQLAAHLAVPAIRTRGAYFLADIARNPLPDQPAGFFRLAQSPFELGKTTILAIYEVVNERALLQRFNQTAITNAVNPRFPATNRIQKNKRTLPCVITDRLPPEIPIVFKVGNIAIRQRAQLRGHDIAGDGAELLSPPEEMLLSGGIQDILNNILKQMCHDIMHRSPNMRTGGAYTTLTRAQLDSVPRSLYMDVQLPFHRLRVALPSREGWFNVIHHLLPLQGDQKGTNTVGYRTALYYEAWCALMVRVTTGEAAQIARAAHEVVAKWEWLPYASATAIWATVDPRDSVVLPADGYGPCPTIAANPFRCRTFHALHRFSLLKV